MTSTEHVHDEARTTPRPQTPAPEEQELLSPRTASVPGALTPSTVLRLQGTIGNQAVQRLLRIQRQDEQEAAMGGAEFTEAPAAQAAASENTAVQENVSGPGETPAGGGAAPTGVTGAEAATVPGEALGGGGPAASAGAPGVFNVAGEASGGGAEPAAAPDLKMSGLPSAEQAVSAVDSQIQSKGPGEQLTVALDGARTEQGVVGPDGKVITYADLQRMYQEAEARGVQLNLVGEAASQGTDAAGAPEATGQPGL